MIDIKHHHCNVLVLVIEFSRFVVELSLDLNQEDAISDERLILTDLDQAVEGLVGDQSLVADVKLEERRGVSPVYNSLVRTRPARWTLTTAKMIPQADLEQGSVRSRKWLLLNLRL